MTSLTKRQLWLLAIALTGLILLTLVAAPSGTSQRQGSTYSRSPDGYGAWYALMQARNVQIQRWQKPDKELPATTRSTLLVVSNGSGDLRSVVETNWVRQGNVLVLLGVKAPVSRSPFSRQIGTPVGAVRIETSRRFTEPSDRTWLSDEFGAVVWEERLGAGRVISATTPFLAANAYQDEPGNFELLADLVTQPGYPIWVDEYSHGYRDAESQRQAETGSLWSYLAQRPIALVGLQAIGLLLLLVWGQNQRLGRPLKLVERPVDNSEAYIQALAEVLRKAECSEFVVEMVSKAEQLAIQQRLGLGSDPLPRETIVAAWTLQTGRSSAELAALLDFSQSPRRVSEADLLKWLDHIRLVRRSLPPLRGDLSQAAVSAVSSPATHV